jgi:hypothetical protein
LLVDVFGEDQFGFFEKSSVDGSGCWVRLKTGYVCI